MTLGAFFMSIALLISGQVVGILVCLNPWDPARHITDPG